MELERRILQRLLPASWFERVDIENTSILRFLTKISSELPDDLLVLDAGAGRCQYRPLFSRQRYIGLDFTLGEETWDYGELEVIGRLEALPVADGAIDVAVCTQVLEHVPEPVAVLRELRRVIRPGGSLFLTAPLAFGEHQEPYDYYRYTSFGLRYLLEKSGFAIESVKPRGGYFWFISAMLTYFYVKLFPASRRRRVRWAVAPVQFLAAVIFLLILPQILYFLDRIDKRRDITLGYACIARVSVQPEPPPGPARPD